MGWNTTDSETLQTDEAIFCIKETRAQPLHVKLKLNDIPVPFEIDTGAAVTIMLHNLPTITLNNTQVALQTYTAEPMKVLGQTITYV